MIDECRRNALRYLLENKLVFAGCCVINLWLKAKAKSSCMPSGELLLPKQHKRSLSMSCNYFSLEITRHLLNEYLIAFFGDSKLCLETLVFSLIWATIKYPTNFFSEFILGIGSLD